MTVVGIDRPGIVAGVTRALYDLGANLEDATSTILRGHFAMMLVVDLPEGSDVGGVENALAPVAEELSLSIHTAPFEGAPRQLPRPTHLVSVYGADRPGIVYKVAKELAERGANITELTSRLMGAEEDPVYAVMLEVFAPQGADVQAALDGLKTQLDVDVTVRSVEADLL